MQEELQTAMTKLERERAAEKLRLSELEVLVATKEVDILHSYL